MNNLQKFRLLTVVLLVSSLFIYANWNKEIVEREMESSNIVENHKNVLLKEAYPSEGKACLTCHTGIEHIRSDSSKMMQKIYEKGHEMGDPNGCVICHQGDPTETIDKNKAHKDLIPFPGSMWSIDKTCGRCHEDYVYNGMRSLMMTEAGKIQGAVWGWGWQESYAVRWGNYDVEDTDGPKPRWGTETYKNYMHRLSKAYPGEFPKKLEEVPQTNIHNLVARPEEAIFTYLRTECLRCHVGVKGKQRRGDYRGMGCASCHIPYSDEGFYEGNDPTITKDIPGHLLVHRIQSSRETKVQVNGITYSGIPDETCTTCHNRGKRIGVSYTGIAEAAYDTPWNEDGSGQYKLHGKRYHSIKDDVHHQIDSRTGNPMGGLLCQDCHTTISVHGNGNLHGTTLAEVEVECADCHGIPDKYPWELPIGYQDEYGLEVPDTARGLSFKLTEEMKAGTVYDAEDGYLLSARGNPFGNVVRRNDSVLVHSASGNDFISPTLKMLNETNTWKHPEKAITAMVSVGQHMKTMECYACHAVWAPQCYGCHVQVDFSKDHYAQDWVETGKQHYKNGLNVDQLYPNEIPTIKAKVREGRSYIRWEDPVLGMNGENRVTPLIPGCQQITTVIDTSSNTLVSNKIWNTPPNVENGGETGQRGIDMSPVQPHTISAEARSCASCHTNPKTLGYGISDGKWMTDYNKDTYKDLQTAQGKILSKHARPQMTAIENLPMDLSQIVTRDGKQLQTVGSHWPLSGPLSQEMREKMERVGVCISCHQDVPNGNIFTKITAAAGEKIGLIPHHDHEHSKLLNQDIKWAAFSRFFVAFLLLIIGFLGWKLWRRKE